MRNTRSAPKPTTRKRMAEASIFSDYGNETDRELMRRSGWNQEMLGSIFVEIGGGLHFGFLVGYFFRHPEIRNGAKIWLERLWKVPGIEDYVVSLRERGVGKDLTFDEHLLLIQDSWDERGWYEGRIGTEDELFGEGGPPVSFVGTGGTLLLIWGFTRPPADVLSFFGATIPQNAALDSRDQRGGQRQTHTLTQPSPFAGGGNEQIRLPTLAGIKLFPLIRVGSDIELVPQVMNHFPNLTARGV